MCVCVWGGGGGGGIQFPSLINCPDGKEAGNLGGGGGGGGGGRGGLKPPSGSLRK